MKLSTEWITRRKAKSLLQKSLAFIAVRSHGFWNKDQLMHDWQNNKNLHRKRKRTGKADDIEKAGSLLSTVCVLSVWQGVKDPYHRSSNWPTSFSHLWSSARPQNVYNFQSRKLFECPAMTFNLPAGCTANFQHVTDLYNLESVMSLKKAHRLTPAKNHWENVRETGHFAVLRIHP